MTMDEVFRSPQYREHMSKISGGRKRSERKRESSIRNLEKANAAKRAGRLGQVTAS